MLQVRHYCDDLPSSCHVSCHRFRSEDPDRPVSGHVEVTYTSLKSVYSILDTYSFPLVRSRVQCTCDCPGGAAHCQVRIGGEANHDDPH